ncbi:MAG TPA: MBL fold metallo-hydrolase [Myxococcaceae bacterium]|nr:MBL fold metallo-hydrolase [Myxococcaceae bacterium]
MLASFVHRWLAAAAALLVVVPTLGAAGERVTVKMRPLQVAPHTYYVRGEASEATSKNQGFMSNAGFVVTKAGVVVFDTLGTPALGEELIRQIRKVTKQPIKRVILSHFHADHSYGLQAFKAVGAEVWAHREGKLYLASELARQRLEQRRKALAPWVDEETRLVPADRWLDGDTTFELGGMRFELFYLGPAHASEDLMMKVSPEGVLFSGDLLFAGRIPFVGEADSKRWLAAIDRLLAFEPKVLVPGHGEVSSRPTTELKLTRDYLTFLREVMKKAVDDFVPFDEAYEQTDWGRFSSYPAFEAANRVNAYNTYLLMEKESLNGR